MVHENHYSPDAAMQIVLSKIEVKLGASIKPEFSVHQKSHPVTCTEECMYASAQRVHRAVTTVVEEIREEESYQLEKAALKLEALAAAYETLAQRYAEIVQLYGNDTAVNVHEYWSATAAIHTDGTKMWEHIKQQASV